MAGKHKPKTYWQEEDKTRAVAVYKATSNLSKTATITGIPLRTINQWVTQEWWDEKVKQLRAEDTAELEQAYTDIAKTSQEVVKDRLRNGDFVLTKEGELIRKPVSMRDAAVAGAIATDKRRILSEEPQRENELGVSERLIKLVEQFARFANAKQVEQVVEKPIIDLVPEVKGDTDAIKNIETAPIHGSSSPQP